MSPKPPTRTPLTHSLWFWVYVFSAAALAALLIMGPRFADRQAQLEKNYQARNRANQRALGQPVEGKVSQPGDTIITLTPLYIGLGILFVLAWVMVWWKFFRPVESKPASRSVPSHEP